ncbi:PrsW family intramembrane metalloprotease [Candidatus Peregrinibacteria bacterium]|nr:MAG: PrsW family intramembrane metalloprotease [Candidatus Peregrinibacteria bacterium]
MILIYQGYWGETINLIFFQVNPVDFQENLKNLFFENPLLALFLSFVGVGVIEEFAKFWMMRLVSRRFFNSIDDVIRLAIISALGFAFYENMVYFSHNWGQLSAGGFFVFALMRVTVVTMVHVLCSGILGYYYGMAHFASPVLKIQYMKKEHHPILQFMKNVLRFKKSDLYYREMYLIGLTLAMGIHAMYDFILSTQHPLAFLVVYVYFFGGFWFLNRLLKKKDLNLKLGLVGTHIMPKEDFVKLLDEIQLIKEKMEQDSQLKLTPHEHA